MSDIDRDRRAITMGIFTLEEDSLWYPWAFSHQPFLVSTSGNSDFLPCTLVLQFNFAKPFEHQMGTLQRTESCSETRNTEF